MKTARIVVWLLTLSVLLSPIPLFASQNDLPKDLRTSLGECSSIVVEIRRQLTDGGAIDTQIARIGTRLEDLRVIHLLLQERYRQDTERAEQLGGMAAQRQAAMADRYNQGMSSLLALLEQLVQAPSQAPQLLPQIEQLLQQLRPSRQTPIHGILPYQPLNYSQRNPIVTPILTPAYQQATTSSVPSDLATTVEAPISTLITDQAQAIATSAGQQNWDPVALYEWVKNNVRTEWYYGVMKGAEETLRQKSGNDADQAALLIALLRASGYPARYVRGVVEFFPGIEAVKAQTGIDDVAAIGTFFRKAGIPYEPVMNGAEIVNYRIEHIWVEALIPYANYRGAMADAQGEIWLPLDTSFKVAGYVETGSIDLFSEVGNPLTTFRDAYLANSQVLTPLELLQQEVTTFLAAVAPGTTYEESLHVRTLRSEVLRILPSAPQFTEIAITGEYTSLPTELIHSVRLQAISLAPAVLPIFDITLPVHALSNRKIAISFEPETVEDQEIINTWGGLDNTPGYLVRLRPVLMVDDERIVVGQEGLASGGNFDLVVELTSPAGTISFANVLLAGYPSVIGLVAQDAVLPDPAALQPEATDLLYREALNYIDRWNQGEIELADLLNLRTTRPAPTVVTLGGAVEVVELLGEPQGVIWKGLSLDADLRVVETVERTLVVDERRQQFMKLSALQGSVLEGRIFETAFDVASISTAKLFGLAGDGAVGILIIDAANAATLVPTLPFADNVKADITSAVAEGLVVKIPAQELSFQAWSGSGYIKEDPVTGAAGYMLSGQIAGGMTAVSPSSWVYAFVYAFESPFAETPNLDPLAAYSIHKIGGTDFQLGAAGEELAEPLSVMVRDIEGRPVQGATVTFTVERGDGNFASAPTITAITDQKGIASTQPKLKLGSNIMAEATTYTEEGYQYASFARENTVSATLANGTELVQPFVAIAIPGAPAQMTPFNTVINGGILHYAGKIGLQVVDRYNNPIANVPIRFVAGTPVPYSPDSVCDITKANQDKLFPQLTTDEACYKTLPSWGECATGGNVVGMTWSNGAVMAGVVMGSALDARYPITASYAGPLSVTLPPAAFIGTTGYIGNTGGNPYSWCGGNTPLSYFTLDAEESLYRVRPAGKPIKVRAKALMVAEGVLVDHEVLSCRNDEDETELLTCSKLIGNQTFDLATPNSMNVSFNGSTGTPGAAPNMYEDTLTLAVGTNSIDARVTANVTVNYYNNNCGDGCASSPTQEPRTYSTGGVIDYIGVAIDMPDFVTVTLDPLGFPVADTPVNYTIQPLNYDAASASFLIYMDDILVYVLTADTMGANTDIIPSYFTFDPNANYAVQVVLNYNLNEIEIWSERVPIVFGDQTLSGGNFVLNRTHHTSEFDSNVPAVGSAYQDNYRTFSFNLAESASVKVSLLDASFVEKAVLVPTVTKTAGTHKFVVDYAQVTDAGLSVYASPEFYIQLQQTRSSDGQVTKTLYRGHLGEQVGRAKMLGQTIVHDVMLQDGSLNVSRTDLEVQGRGPDFSFTRSYNNQQASEQQNLLGNGWSHSLDLRLYLLNSATEGNGPVPDWVNTLKGTFYAPGDEPGPTTFGWNQVQANGTLFRQDAGGTWYAQRGSHGRLSEIAGGFRFTAKDGTKYDYTITGNARELLVSRIEDRNGNALIFNYGSFNHLDKVTDAVGREFSFAYQTFSVPDEDPARLISITGPDNLLLTFSYDMWGNLKTATRGARTENYEYVREAGIVQGDFNLVKITDANNHVTRYIYHSAGEIDANLSTYVKMVKPQDMVKQVIYPDDASATITYSATGGNKRTVKDLRGHDTLYTLNARGNPLRIDEPLGKTMQMTWSIDQGQPDNVMTSRTVSAGTLATPRLLTTYFEYDAKGNVTKETDPYGHFIQATWDQNYSLPLTRTDRNGVEQHWFYDPTIAGCLNRHEIEVTPGIFQQTDSTCYPTGEVKTVIDPRGNVTRTTYDVYGNPDLVTVADNSTDPNEKATTDYDFDVRGRKTALTDPNGNRTAYTYDALDYPATMTLPALTAYALPAGSSRVKTTVYDSLGNLLNETDRTGLTLTYTYTPRNQVETITRSAGANSYGVKTFDYDANGNLTSETDWKGVATTHTYDALNRRDSTTNRLGDGMSMVFDLANNLVQVTDYAGRVTDYEYDDLNRQAKMIQPLLPGQATRGEIVKTYYFEADPETNLKTTTDAEQHTTRFEYNGRYQRTRRISAEGELDYEFRWVYDDAGNLEKTIDEELNETRYVYDKQNRRTFTYKAIKDASGAIVREIPAEEQRFDAAGNVRFVVDANNNTTEKRYDEWNRLWQTKTPVDLLAGVSYTAAVELDGEGREVKASHLAVTSGVEQIRTWMRDARGLVTIATDAELQPTVYTYDDNDNVETVTNARDYATRTNYDAEDRKLLTVEAEGTPEARITGVVLYDKVGNPLQVRDGNGNIFVTEFNALNLPWKQYAPAPFNANFVETRYDKNGRVASITNRRGHTTTTSYDPLGRVTTITDPAPFNTQTVVTTYDKVGNVKTVKDKRDILAENDYDDLYRLVEQRRAGIRLVTNEYDDAGNKTAAVDAENHRVEYAYNSRNLLETTTYIDGVNDYTEVRRYDGLGNLLTLTNEEQEVTSYTYDKENRKKTTAFAGETTENFYDQIGNLERVQKPKGNNRSMTYDGLNRLATVTEGGLLTTAYTYDANGNLLTQEDPRGNVVEFTYDELNRKKQHIQQKATGNLAVSYDLYDAEGNLKQMTDAKGQVFTYDYDELNRQTLVDYPLVATPFVAVDAVVTSYDANNNVTTMTETKQQSGGGTLTDVTVNTWDNFDRLETSTQRGMTVTYGYDHNGNRTSVATVNGSTTYTFDHRNRLKTAVVGTDTTVYGYTPDGFIDTVTYPNGTSTDYTYWPSNRVQTIAHGAGATPISSYSYIYDANGNRTQQVEVQGGVTGTTDYDYDTLDRLENFTLTSGNDTTVTAYTFEGYNRKTETVTVNSATTVNKTYDYDETNWLTQVIDSAAAPAVTITYSYDDNGNTLLKTDSSKPGQDVTFVYDVANRLVQTTQGATLLGQYDYNADGLRVRHYGSERGDVDYYYDDGAVLEEYVTGAGGGLLAHYRYGDRLLSLYSPDDGGVQYYHHDALGSTVNLTDGAGATKVGYTLDPWGNIRNQVGSSVNRQIFTGQEHDENTGLIYFGARYYDPDTARFISQDSYLGEPGTPPSLHRYLYAYSNPTIYVDLFGYISNRQVFGVDDNSVERTLKEDNSLSSVLALTAKSTMYTLWNGVTGGFVGRQDERQEKYDRNELTDGEFWAGTGIDGGISVGAQVIGGSIASKATGTIGSKFVGAAVGGTVDSGVGSLVSQSGQVITHEATSGKIGQESINYAEVALSAGSGMVMAGGIYAGQQAVGAVAASVKSQLAPVLTREVKDGGYLKISLLPHKVEAASTALIIHPFANGATHITTLDRWKAAAEKYPEFGRSTGLYVAPTDQINALLAKAKSRQEIEITIGHEKGQLAGSSLVRIDIENPFEHALRLPDPKTGNRLHIKNSGVTLGGLNEGVINPIKHPTIPTIVKGF